MLRPAFPCSFGSAAVPTAEYYTDGFGGQIDGLRVRHARVVVPTKSDLVEWTKSCLELDEYASYPESDPYGGWSPGRSLAVKVRSFVGITYTEETFYYRCMDFGHSHIQVFQEPTSDCMKQWVRSWRTFLIISWNALSQRNLCSDRAHAMIRGESGAWDPRWIHKLAQHVDVSWQTQSTAVQRARLCAWSMRLLQIYETDLVRLCVASVFLNDPLHIHALIRRGHK